LTARLELPELATQYRICGLTLASEIPLPELIPIARPDLAQKIDIRVRLGKASPGQYSNPNWFTVFVLPGGEAGLLCAKESFGYRLRFPELADFRVDTRGGEIVCETAQGFPPATLRHLLLDQVIPRTLSLLGIEALHATAVLTPYGVCAFAGNSGAGKSTLAASFHLAGYPALSDDCLVLHEKDGAILVTPAYPGLRLFDDSAAALCVEQDSSPSVAHYSSKRRVLADSSHVALTGERHLLARVYELVDTAGTRAESIAEGPSAEDAIAEPMPGREAFMFLIKSAFRIDVSDRNLLARQFDFFERVVSLVPVRRLRVPADFSALPAIREIILADLRMGGANASRVL
jgi:hypothetical protein